MMRQAGEGFNEAGAAVGARIRRLRLAQGLSQEQLADIGGCDRTYVGMLERGTGNPSLRVLSAIAAGLGVPIEKLFA